MHHRYHLACLSILAILAYFAPCAFGKEYFLDLEQKGDVLLYGRMTGRDQQRYDIWIVPGYVPPLRNARGSWIDAADDFSRYGKKDFYKHLYSYTKGTVRFGLKDTIAEFALEESANAWISAFQSANERVDRRVFGWWFAYPWAVFEGTVVSLFRLGIGIPGGILIAGFGATVVPVGYALTPAGVGLFDGVGRGTIWPVVAMSWNTIVAPPLALLGQQPSEKRADGFWVTRLDDPAEATMRDMIDRWQQSLGQSAKSRGAAQSIEQLNTNLQTKTAEHYKAIEDLNSAYGTKITETQAIVNQEVKMSAYQKKEVLMQELQSKGLTNERLAHMHDYFLNKMLEAGLTYEDAEQLFKDLTAQKIPGPTRDPNNKTNPLKRSIEVIRERH